MGISMQEWRFCILACLPRLSALCEGETAFKETILPACSGSNELKKLDIAVTEAMRRSKELYHGRE